jgi:hypothetical protein
VKPHKSSIKFGRVLNSLLGSWDLLSLWKNKKGTMAYRLALPDSLRHMHDVFHVSVLRHYISDPTHVIDMISL